MPQNAKMWTNKHVQCLNMSFCQHFAIVGPLGGLTRKPPQNAKLSTKACACGLKVFLSTFCHFDISGGCFRVRVASPILRGILPIARRIPLKWCCWQTGKKGEEHVLGITSCDRCFSISGLALAPRHRNYPRHPQLDDTTPSVPEAAAGSKAV